jgi:DsbC/DsbD-like thiol-disulfide interchange protein
MAATKVRGGGHNYIRPHQRRRRVTIISVARVGRLALHSTVMIQTIVQRTLVAAIFAVGAARALPAQDASGWDAELHAAARLIGGATDDTTLLRAGLEIRLDPGWKTYWRYPGDSGVPPTLDFAGSQNVRSVTLLWPAPKRFADGAGGQSLGYSGDVVLPLHVVPADASKPAALRVKLGYAVCGNVCIPAQADLDLTLSGKPGVEEPALTAAEAHVPRRVAFGASEAHHGLAVRSMHRETDGAKARVIVEVAAPDGVPVDLFVEGPTPDWALPLPELASDGRGVRHFTFILDGLPPGAQPQGAMLTLTAVSPDDAIEVEARLD